MLDLLCYLIAFVLFVLVGFNVQVGRWILLGFAGAAAVLPSLVGAFQAVT